MNILQESSLENNNNGDVNSNLHLLTPKKQSSNENDKSFHVSDLDAAQMLSNMLKRKKDQRREEMRAKFFYQDFGLPFVIHYYNCIN